MHCIAFFAFILFPFFYISFRKYTSSERQSWCHFGLSQLYAFFLHTLQLFAFILLYLLKLLGSINLFERQIWCNFGLSQLYKCIKSVLSKENHCSRCYEKKGSSKGKIVLAWLPTCFFESNSWISLNRLLWSSKPQTSFPIQLREH